MSHPIGVTPRRFDLDNLRTFLTVLVIVHHTAISYGGEGGWFYKSPLFDSPRSPPLFVLTAVDQTFFMGLFFWISGRVSAQSLEHSPAGTARFAKTKLLRLGLPAVVYTVVIQPFTMCLGGAHGDISRARAIVADYFARQRGIRGPVWYTALLLVFDLAAVCVVHIRQARSRPDGDDAPPALLLPAAPEKQSTLARRLYRPLARWGWLAVALVSFFVRLVYPAGTPTRYVIVILPAYLPQYVFAYALGHLAYAADEPRLVGPFDPPRRPPGVQLPESGPASPPPPPSSSAALPRTPSLQPHGELGDSAAASPSQAAGNGPRSPDARPALYLASALALTIVPLAAHLALGGGTTTRSGFAPVPPAPPAPSSSAASVSARLDDTVDRAKGGWNVAAAQYAVWNELGFATIGPALGACFLAYWNAPPPPVRRRQRRLGFVVLLPRIVWRARYSYAAFLLHPPACVAVDMAVDGAMVAWLGADRWRDGSTVWRAVGPTVMAVAMGLLGAVASWVMAWVVVEGVPGVGRVL